MGGKSSQCKGREAERSLAKLLQEYGHPVTAGAPRSYGSTPDLIGLPYIHSEVKRVEKLNVHEALKQSIRDADRFGDGMPALFHRRSREPWLVTMRLDDWLEIYDYYVETRSKE